jgi:hypothetical protein
MKTQKSFFLGLILLVSQSAFSGNWTAHIGQGQSMGSPPILVLTDVIAPGDTQSLEQEMSRHGLGNGVRVHLNSRGGDVDESMRMGHFLRQHNAIVTHSDPCASSCVFAFLGGTKRIGNTSGKLLIHQPQATRMLVESNSPSSRAILKHLKDYTVEMTGTPEFFDAMIVQPFEAPRPLSFAEMARMRVVTEFDR